jgi:hypothetical protein
MTRLHTTAPQHGATRCSSAPSPRRSSRACSSPLPSRSHAFASMSEREPTTRARSCHSRSRPANFGRRLDDRSVVSRASERPEQGACSGSWFRGSRSELYANSPPSFDHGVCGAAEGPTNARGWRRRRDLSPMNAFEVAPRAKAGHVLGGVVAAVGAESEMMRRDVTAAATGTPAAIARPNSPVCAVAQAAVANAKQNHSEPIPEDSRGRSA